MDFKDILGIDDLLSVFLDYPSFLAVLFFPEKCNAVFQSLVVFFCLRKVR